MTDEHQREIERLLGEIHERGQAARKVVEEAYKNAADMGMRPSEQIEHQRHLTAMLMLEERISAVMWLAMDVSEMVGAEYDREE